MPTTVLMDRFHTFSTQNLDQWSSEMCQGLMAPKGLHQSLPTTWGPMSAPWGHQPLSQWCHSPAQPGHRPHQSGSQHRPTSQPGLSPFPGRYQMCRAGLPSCPPETLCWGSGTGQACPCHPSMGSPHCCALTKFIFWRNSEKLWEGPEQETRKNKWKTFYKAHLGYFKHSSLPRHRRCDGKQLRSKEQEMPQEQHIFSRVTGLSSGHVSSKKRKKAETKTS